MIKIPVLNTKLRHIKLWSHLNHLVNKFHNLSLNFKLGIILLSLAISLVISLFCFFPFSKPLTQTGPALSLPIQKPEPTRIERVERAPLPLELAQAEYERVMSRLQQEGAPPKPVDQQSAIKTLRQILGRLPNYAPAREALAVLLIKQGNFVQAKQVVEIGLHQDPTYLPYLKLQLHILDKEGNIEQALRLLQDIPPGVLESDADYVPILAHLYLQQGRYEQAVQAYQGLLKTAPDNAAWSLGLGLALEGLGKLQEALQVYLLAQPRATAETREYIEQRIQALR